MIDFLKDYSNLITALATVIYMCFTWWLIWETRKTRIMQEKPHIEIFVKRNEWWWSMLDLVIKNIWYSWAYNLKFEIDKNFNLLDKDEKDIYKLDNLWFFKNWISFLPANWEISNLFTILSTNYAEKIKWKINISCNYNDKYWNKIKDAFLIDLSMFEDTFLPQEKSIYKIEKHLWKIEKNFHRIATWFSELRIISQTKRQYQKEQEDIVKRMK